MSMPSSSAIQHPERAGVVTSHLHRGPRPARETTGGTQPVAEAKRHTGLSSRVFGALPIVCYVIAVTEPRAVFAVGSELGH